MSSSSSDEDQDLPVSKKSKKSSSNTELKKIRGESLQILETLESEYRHDLAIHLYSTHLFHKRYPFYPASRWASWPLPMKSLPKPRVNDLYIDEEDISGTHKENEETNEPLTFLKKELNACFSRIILQKIYEHRDETGQNVEPITDPPIKIPLRMEAKVIAKIDSILDFFKSASNVSYRLRKTTWREILLATGNEAYYEGCRDLFESEYDYQPKIPMRSTNTASASDEETDSDEEEILESDTSDEEERPKVVPKLRGKEQFRKRLEDEKRLVAYENNLYEQILKSNLRLRPIILEQRFTHEVDPLKLLIKRNLGVDSNKKDRIFK